MCKQPQNAAGQRQSSQLESHGGLHSAGLSSSSDAPEATARAGRRLSVTGRGHAHCTPRGDARADVPGHCCRLHDSRTSGRMASFSPSFAFQIMSSWFVEAANHTCGNWDVDDDEFDLSGLTKVPSDNVKAPRVYEGAPQTLEPCLHCACVPQLRLCQHWSRWFARARHGNRSSAW